MKQFLFLNAFAYCRYVQDYIKILNHQSKVIQITVTIQNLSAVSAWSTDSLLKLNLKICICENKGTCSGRLILFKKSHKEILRRQIMANGKQEVTANSMAADIMSAEAPWPEALSHVSVGSLLSLSLHFEPLFAMALMCMVHNIYGFLF